MSTQVCLCLHRYYVYTGVSTQVCRSVRTHEQTAYVQNPVKDAWSAFGLLSLDLRPAAA